MLKTILVTHELGDVFDDVALSELKTEINNLIALYGDDSIVSTHIEEYVIGDAVVNVCVAEQRKETKEEHETRKRHEASTLKHEREKDLLTLARLKEIYEST